jgi:hypothetical protein
MHRYSSPPVRSLPFEKKLMNCVHGFLEHASTNLCDLMIGPAEKREDSP